MWLNMIFFFFFFGISEQSHRLCNMSNIPISEAGGKDRSVFSDTILEAVKNLTVPITVLHITSMSALRSDAHVGKWNGNPSIPDCSHWCLPGVPDMWNEILLSYLLSLSWASSQINCSGMWVSLPIFFPYFSASKCNLLSALLYLRLFL
jgi:hypothetical protein